MWPSAVTAEPWCDAAEADSDNRLLYRESPWGLVKAASDEFLPASTPLLS